MSEVQAPVIPASDPCALSRAADELRAGRIVGLPTETVYGLGVLPAPGPLARLIAAKARDPAKGIALIIDELDQARAVVRVPEVAERLAERYWPGPLTLVLERRPEAALPEALTGGRGTVALRIPDHAVPRALARRLGPLAVSSANPSGQPEARTADELLRTVGGAVALVVDDGPARTGIASTVVSVSTTGEVRVLRAGALPSEEVLALAGAVSAAGTLARDTRRARGQSA
jgi:L-threonylcarbamoyladenylate synthase